MYKHASANLQRRSTRIMQAQIGHLPSEDLIPTAGNMSFRECMEERTRLKLENTRTQNEIAAAKQTGDWRTQQALGLRFQAGCQRLGLIADRLKQLHAENEHWPLKQALQELVPPDLMKRVWARVDDLRDQATNK